MRKQMQYSNVLARIAVTARASLPTLREGGEFLGFIPKSVRIFSAGWAPDIISYTTTIHKLPKADTEAVSQFCMCNGLNRNFATITIYFRINFHMANF